MAQALEAVHAVDPKQVIVGAVASTIAQMSVLGARVLIGVYVRPEMIRTKGGMSLYIPAKTRDEDKYQGKVGLILALGPLAFTEDAAHKWGGRAPRIGDWVQVQVYETKPFEALTASNVEDGNQRCRYVEDVDVLAVLERPDLVW